MADDKAIESARRVLKIEAQAVGDLADRLDSQFADAVAHLLTAKGRVIVCGMGKSGIIAHKIAATLMSTGTPSFYMHPGEAYHGDLGMVTPEDTFIAISNSGETEELIKLLPYLSASGNFLIAMTGNSASTLATKAHCRLDVSVREEACPLHLAPTSSTTATLAMGDALAIALMEARGFGAADFARFHPGGTLGRLLSRVEDEMITAQLPIIVANAGFIEVVQAITGSNLGLTLVREGDMWAIITDGDLRRAVERYGPAVFDRIAGDLMTYNPAGVPVGTRMEDALAKMDRTQVNALVVFDREELVGILKK
ncbi:KpsF/GutQ family sugar-phosphate isomerase [Cryobacterium sp. AP23]